MRRFSVKGAIRKAQAFASTFAVAAILNANAAVREEGTEYSLAVPLPGDQAHADLALGPSGGYMVWDDNVGDSDGMAVNLRLVTSSLSGALNVIPLATKTAGHQENPRATLLAQGGAAFVWQGGEDSNQRVYLRIISGAGVFIGDEIAVSARTDLHQIRPVVAGLANGNIIVAWSSFGQDGDLQGVYGALFTSSGIKIGAEFQINQFTGKNQRNAALTALPGGGFVVAWISEGQRDAFSVDVYARIYGANGAPVTSEFRVNNSDNICSSPSVAATSSGNFTLAWCETAQDKNFTESEALVVPIHDEYGWEIFAGSFTPEGGRLAGPTKVNQFTKGAQINPSIAAVGRTHLVVWQSFGQDGDWEGVVGRTLNGLGAPADDEFIVNTDGVGRQHYPVVRGNGESRFLVAWSSFVSLEANVELKAQRYVAEQEVVTLPQPAAPYVTPLSQSRLSVTWPSVDGLDVAHYELYREGVEAPIIVTNQLKVISGLAPATTLRFEVAYRLRDGQLSPRSPQGVGRTFAEDLNEDTIPDDWQEQYWGGLPVTWPAANADSDRDGVSNYSEYLAGTDPTDPQSVLRTQLLQLPGGLRLSWNTTPGSMYQVQHTTDLFTWSAFGGQRLAPGATDSVGVPAGNSIGYYRLIRIR